MQKVHSFFFNQRLREPGRDMRQTFWSAYSPASRWRAGGKYIVVNMATVKTAKISEMLIQNRQKKPRFNIQHLKVYGF